MCNLKSVNLETVLVSVQDRCTVCPKHTIGSEIVWDAPNGTARYEAQVEACLVQLEIVLVLTQDR